MCEGITSKQACYSGRACLPVRLNHSRQQQIRWRKDPPHFLQNQIGRTVAHKLTIYHVGHEHQGRTLRWATNPSTNTLPLPNIFFFANGITFDLSQRMIVGGYRKFRLSNLASIHPSIDQCSIVVLYLKDLLEGGDPKRFQGIFGRLGLGKLAFRIE